VPVILRDADRPSQAQWALVENIQREDLTPIDRALAYRDLIAQLGLTQAELGNRLGEQRSSIANFLRLLELEPIVRDWIATGALSLGHAKVLAGLTDKAQQVVLAERCVSQGLSVRDLERNVASTQKNQGPPPTTPPRSAHLAELESRLTQHVGLRVNVQKSAAKGKGKVVIHYANLDQFEDLLRKLGYEAAAD
ncbi:MAG: ParB/RepB/Spo0J family partition protein, partial [Tepidisphaeraceae bacterium]